MTASLSANLIVYGMTLKTKSLILLSVFLVMSLVGCATAPVSGDRVSPMSADEFGDYVFEYLSENYEERGFEKSDEPLVLTGKDVQVGLTNLYAQYLENELAKDELKGLLSEHFQNVFVQLDERNNSGSSDWEIVKKRLMPMFAPIEYAERLGVIHTKIDQYVLVAYVLDSARGYRYVTEKDMDEWGVSLETIQDIAEKNLWNQSKNTEMQGNFDKAKFVMLQTHDGYDAARLLVPEFRDFIASKLGYPFHAGIPNRDFLIMWSANNPKSLTSGFVNGIEADFQSKPYPLTPNVLEVHKDRIVPLAKKPFRSAEADQKFNR